MVKEKKTKSKPAGRSDGSAAASGLGVTDVALAERLQIQATRVICSSDMNYNTSSSLASTTLPGVDSSFKLDNFKQSVNIEVTKYENHDMEFEVKGISCAMANTLRRIMIAEIPTMAIEHVFIVNNTSIIQDEVLAHRLGLIPLNVDPRLFDFKATDETATERNTIVMKLKVECKKLPDGTIENEKVYSSQLVWLPNGSEMPEETATPAFETSQSEMFEMMGPVHDDILIAKLRPGQAIELECHCIKGVGEEHAKWSPVATTWYRLVPEVVLLEQPPLDVAKKLESELPGLITVASGGVVEVDDARRHGNVLEKVRRMSGEPEWSPYIQLRKCKDHFIFTIESTGAWRPHELFKEAVDRIVSKCDKVLEGLAKFPRTSFDYK
ncbi:hypothetical protein Ndes2437A_g01045 [Nannochloris sp. 'desiccata']